MTIHDKKYTALQSPEGPAVTADQGTKGSGLEQDCCSFDDHGDSSHTHQKQAADEHSHHGHSQGSEDKASWWPTAISLGLLLGGILLDQLAISWFSGALRLAVYGLAYLLTGGKVVWQAAKSIAKGSIFNEFFLMSLATVGAFYLGEYAEGVAVMLFYVIGEHFQGAAVARSRKSIKALLDNRPAVVNLVRLDNYVCHFNGCIRA